jgi:three-Cys-motif partner protein
VAQKHYDWQIGEEVPKIGAHSLAKHRILRRYIERYIEIVTATSRQEQLSITFVDGYSGGGRYLSGREMVSGSPLIFLEAVKAAEQRLNASRPKGFRINANYIFVDQNPKHTEFLRAEILASPFSTELDQSIQILTADFNDRVEDIVRAVRARSPRKGRAVFLLDQYGWSQVAFRSIRTILTELPKAEVFLTFSVDALIDYLSERSFEMRAFGEIDIDAGLVRELIQVKEAEQVGYRTLIQNGLYRHVQAMTGAPFYSPFFIKSPEAHRSYWFIHLSKHREARNEIGMIHWGENNTTIHHGGAGLHALGFTPGGNIEQMTMSYLFDESAKAMSRKKLAEQLPRLIHDAADADVAPSLELIFGLRCNDTPVVREILEESLISLRNEGELIIVDESGKLKPRAGSVEWTDRIVLPPQRSFLGPFAQFKKPVDVGQGATLVPTAAFD